MQDDEGISRASSSTGARTSDRARPPATVRDCMLAIEDHQVANGRVANKDHGLENPAEQSRGHGHCHGASDQNDDRMRHILRF